MEVSWPTVWIAIQMLTLLSEAGGTTVPATSGETACPGRCKQKTCHSVRCNREVVLIYTSTGAFRAHQGLVSNRQQILDNHRCVYLSASKVAKTKYKTK
ncbi:hypothetical protein PF005_g10976 [Phytophthora fragariae]|uniref:Secreted protein n=1 Tax=Phytophthora fragariae TaxID=53985 RepID=A0A6A3SG34_9STRA|nr:hypothetical protein PF003_g34260 [Phytophthora fragariae]KAE8938723.1 hypothetical protein PF009_g11398 [Phytophthora fragariae]KAE9114892.1 hypothetical protein PF007_g10213 [Phytophthora fragariae]KAE9146211.1 hypothetical protein PF006_g9005 [Phytophthora fragariae]KAE9211497.1 hypothetical protein PF005_g10976 [Phytophthora fragariae]